MMPCLICWPRMQAYIGPPSHAARYTILRSCCKELQRAGIVAADDPIPPTWDLAAAHAEVQANCSSGHLVGALEGCSGAHAQTNIPEPERMHTASYGGQQPMSATLPGACKAGNAPGTIDLRLDGSSMDGGTAASELPPQEGERGIVPAAVLSQVPLPDTAREELNAAEDPEKTLLIGSLLWCDSC